MPIPGVRETAAGWVAVTKNSPPPAQPQSSQRRWFTWKKPASTPEAPVIERAAFRYDNIVEYADRAVAAIGAIAHSDCFKKGILGERNATGAILTNRLFDCLENMLKVDQLARKAQSISEKAEAAGITDTTGAAIEKSIKASVIAPVCQLEELASQVLILDLQAVNSEDFRFQQPTSFEDLEGRVFAAAQLSEI
ncbi:hypothetical protein [Corynebacterium amycolatum]|uniref:hypothetical protein n=1 Tax=Corynebacterium amycolatum TaxID=43765 RepID=UPI0025509639|nr:hypothetical protein [Corynebacterium amycolatum]MDK7145127.1 hypothetical protein [Corynebacterium amycolatum]